jgi:hypothetical protein
MVREGCCNGLGAVRGMQDKAQATFNDFNNKMYRARSDVSIGFCGPHHVMSLRPRRKYEIDLFVATRVACGAEP